MNPRQRRFNDELLFLLFLPACGIASVIVAMVVALSAPVVILPAVAQSIPTPTRVPLRPTATPTLTVTPSPTLTPAPLTPTATPPTPTITPTPTEIALNGIWGMDIYTRTSDLWVTNAAGNSVSEVDAKDPNLVRFTLYNIPSPNEISIWQARGLAYVTNPTRNTITEIDLAARRVSATFDIGISPKRLTVDQTTGDVYVITSKGTTLAILSAKTRTVSPILWKAGATDVAWYGVAGSVVVANQDSTVQTYTQNGPGDPIKVGPGLDSIAIRPTTFFGAAALRTNPSTNVFITSPSRQGLYGITGTTPSFFGLKARTGAIADMGRCMGVVLPDENSFVTLDYELTRVTARYQLGAQGLDGGNGLAYNRQLDFAYVANHASNSITLLTNPCPTFTPTPTFAPIPFFPTFQIPAFPFVPVNPTSAPVQ